MFNHYWLMISDHVHTTCCSLDSYSTSLLFWNVMLPFLISIFEELAEIWLVENLVWNLWLWYVIWFIHDLIKLELKSQKRPVARYRVKYNLVGLMFNGVPKCTLYMYHIELVTMATSIQPFFPTLQIFTMLLNGLLVSVFL